VTLIVAFVLFGVIVLPLAAGVVVDVAYTGRVRRGVSLAGHDLSGLTVAQVQDVLTQLQDNISVELTMDGSTKTATGADVGIAVNRPEILTDLQNLKTTFWVDRFTSHITVPLAVTIDSAQFNSWVGKNFPGHVTVPVNASIVYDPATDRFKSTQAVPGTGVPTTELDSIAAALANQSGRGSFTLSTTALDAPVTGTKALSAQNWINQRLSSPCSLSYNGTTLYTLTPGEIAAMTTVAPDGSTLAVDFDQTSIQTFIQQTLAPKVNKSPVDETVITNEAGDPLSVAQKGADGRTLTDTGTLGQNIESCLILGQTTPVELSFDVTPFSTKDTISLDPINAAVGKQIDYLVTYATTYNTAEWGNDNSVGGDCANFVSQGLYVRGIPMDSTWYSTGPGGGSPAWVSVPALDDWLSSQGWTRLGLDQLDQLKLGDIGIFDWNLDGIGDHAMTVSRIYKSGNSLTVYFASHNEDGAYRELSTVINVDHPGANAWFYSVP